jgi:hypothetical protein
VRRMRSGPAGSRCSGGKYGRESLAMTVCDPLKYFTG